MKLFDALFHRWDQQKQQMRLAELQAELEIAQEDCAALGAHIGELVRKKQALETEMQRGDA